MGEGERKVTRRCVLLSAAASAALITVVVAGVVFGMGLHLGEPSASAMAAPPTPATHAVLTQLKAGEIVR